MLEYLKAILYGIVEGITEWLPISSTGHLILTQNFFPFGENVSSSFPEMFNYVIQLGAIFAVIVLFWKKLWPFKMPDKNAKFLSVDTGVFKKEQWTLWFKVLVATLPSVLGLIVDDKIDSLMYDEAGNPNLMGLIVISVALVFYGVLFIVVERKNKNRAVSSDSVFDITYKTALIIGFFQLLAIIPGTSRSGATIIGALIIGISRPAAAEFSFFMAIPTMFGVSFLKIAQFLLESSFTSDEIIILAIGMVVSFAVSMICIKKLMQYVKKHDFSLFGYYRIVLGIVLLLYFLLKP
ncbi:MAG: undecaprenyl-diphosphate phosphatase [Ruminococcaceae bacterium]|nr:undecaprenyl-diphosphate phosphatase [Oscillospiraceae bacterium]